MIEKKTLVGVLSDTHMLELESGLSKLLVRVFRDVGTVLHCGDYVDYAVVEMLKGEGWEVIGVAGNMDGETIRRMLPETRKVTIENHTIGLVHGWGSRNGIEKRVAQCFDDVEGVVFGHSHRSYWGRMGDIWLFNPGSARDWNSPFGRATVGILEIGDYVQGRIVRLNDFTDG